MSKFTNQYLNAKVYFFNEEDIEHEGVSVYWGTISKITPQHVYIDLLSPFMNHQVNTTQYEHKDLEEMTQFGYELDPLIKFTFEKESA